MRHAVCSFFLLVLLSISAVAVGQTELAQARQEIEKTELEYYRLDRQLVRQFQLLKQVLAHSRGSRSPLWTKLVQKEYYRFLDILVATSEKRLKVLKGTLTISDRARELFKQSPAELDTHDAWVSTVDSNVAPLFPDDWFAVQRRAIQYLPAGKVRTFHLGALQAERP